MPGGTYALILRNPKACNVEVGRLGPVRIPRGYLVYTGSAFGPGGLEARVGRHLKSCKPRRWHIDYLTVGMPVIRAWQTRSPDRLECAWAAILEKMGGRIPVNGFGASDCGCTAHLFHFPRLPSFTAFRRLAAPVPVRSLRTT